VKNIILMFVQNLYFVEHHFQQIKRLKMTDCLATVKIVSFTLTSLENTLSAVPSAIQNIEIYSNINTNIGEKNIYIYIIRHSSICTQYFPRHHNRIGSTFSPVKNEKCF